LPEDNTVAAATPVAKPESPNLNEQQSASKAAMSYPVSGKVIRPYSKGKNNGIDIAADAGTPVTAAANGTVAAITKDADDVTILVVRHPNNLMTVYYNVDGVKVKKGASVKRGQSMAVLPAENSFVHFEVREGFDSVDPAPYLK
jgi:murein DD-endopeptidase MepM/ murein hydrolase activator NlpD